LIERLKDSLVTINNQLKIIVLFPLTDVNIYRKMSEINVTSERSEAVSFPSMRLLHPCGVRNDMILENISTSPLPSGGYL
jgi:hypothetical protein